MCFFPFAYKVSEGAGEEVMLHSLVLHHSFHTWDHGSLWQSYCACFPIWGHCFFFFLLAFFPFRCWPLFLSWFPLFSFCLFFKLSLVSACLSSCHPPHAAFPNPLRHFINARGDYPPQTESSSTSPLSSSGTVGNILVDLKHFCIQYFQPLQYHLYLFKL